MGRRRLLGRNKTEVFEITFDSITLDVATSFSIPAAISDISANADFSKLYLSLSGGANANINIREINNPDPSDISQATYSGKVKGVNHDIRAIHADSVNGKLYVGRQNVYELDLDNVNFTNSALVRSKVLVDSMRGMSINSSLDKMIYTDSANNFREFNLTAGDVSTLTDTTKTKAIPYGNTDGICVKGNKLLVYSGASSKIIEYTINGYDVNSLSLTGNEKLVDPNNFGILVIPSAKKILIAGGGTIKQYSYKGI